MGATTIEAGRRKRLERLRNRAEQSLRKSETLHKAPKGRMLEVLHEMSIYQAELEIQNEELQRSQLALQDSRRRYADLYDFAPVGYLTLDTQGLIKEVNLAAAELMGVNRRDLLHQAFHRFLATESRPIFYQFVRRLSKDRGRPTCELRLIPKAGVPLDVHLAGNAIPESNGRATLCRVALIDVTARKKTEQELKDSRAELQALMSRLHAVREEERTELAREIHDEMSGTLTALKLELSLLPDRAAKDGSLFLEKLDSMAKLIDHALARVQSIATQLRPIVLDKLGLVAAIEWQASDFQERSKIACETRLPEGDLALDSERATAVFRIFQEALTNVTRHANATQVLVELRSQAGDLILTVRDNGKGISAKAIEAHDSLGLLGMRERAMCFGGRTEVSRARGGGTLVSVRLPQRSE
jgi:PAS domain S-box-containing protein